ncbi:unnamed protein product [Anisakis simplex]|uniref:SH3 domain-containing protein n=1 Tax=Anisakis simplex TaxID=6269 RepID=A0A0M3K503_ANISI|nr:unnamed protein product [Anisakis simplex]
MGAFCDGRRQPSAGSGGSGSMGTSGGAGAMMGAPGVGGVTQQGILMDDQSSPSYWVEHLATFAVGREFGLQSPADGVRKLKQLEKNSAIWAQPMVLRLRPNVVSVEDENGDLVEQFPMELVTDPSAHISNDPRDSYNNILLFIVQEDKRRGRNLAPTEMHIFQCNRVSANEVVEDMRAFMTGQYQRVAQGRRDMGLIGQTPYYGGPALPGWYFSALGGATRGVYRDDTSAASSDGSEYFERDVNTLNRCFDDIERFVARIQSAAIAQRELEAQTQRMRQAQQQQQRKRGKETANNNNNTAQLDAQSGILQMRAQLPADFEFVDILQKFKLSFNLLAKLKNHIHEPNAPELLHFLFTPLTIILDACHWGLGRNIAQQPYRPVFMDGYAPYGPPDNYDAFVSQGYNRYMPPPGEMQPPGQPQPMHRVSAAAAAAACYDFGETDVREKHFYFSQERQRIEKEKEMIAQEAEQRSMASSYATKHEYILVLSISELVRIVDGVVYMAKNVIIIVFSSRQQSPAMGRRGMNGMMDGGGGGASAQQALGPIPQPDPSPRQKAFLDDIVARRAKLVQVTYDRVAQNAKELTVSRGEYLEVLNDNKNWWECTNVHHRVGYVPHTILSVVQIDRDLSPRSNPPQDPGFHPSSDRANMMDRNAAAAGIGMQQQHGPPPPPSGGYQPAMQKQSNINSAAARPGMKLINDDDTPEYIKQRQGKRGEFRYF